jgi:hypothetical protein
MASAELSRRVEKVVAYPPLSELSDLQRREFREALLETDDFEDPALLERLDDVDVVEDLRLAGELDVCLLEPRLELVAEGAERLG